MPIYMDRHDVSEEVTAEMVAHLHQEDLKIQHKYNCKGLTYWFDDKRKTAFCLVEAPNKSAIKEMHDKAHGEVPNRIIEVDHAVVESFLGRIEDPEKSKKTTLNIINDPAFRTIMVLGIKASSLKENLRKELAEIISEMNNSTINAAREYEGRIVKRNQDHFLLSFVSVTNAVLFALNIQHKFSKAYGSTCHSSLKLKIGINAGVPVDVKEGIFESTIKIAYSYFDLVKGNIIISSEVKDLYESENIKASLESSLVFALKESDENFIKDLADFTELQWRNASLSINDFTSYFGYSKSTLYRKIVGVTGASPNSYIKAYRLNKSLNLLNKREKNISEIAFDTGFNSPAYFSKCFHQTFGILPSEYLK